MHETIIGRDEEDLRKLGDKLTIVIGKNLVGIGEDVHLTTPILMDVARPHVIVIAGKRGAGKSYTLGVIAEEMAKLPRNEKKNITLIIIDTQGIFWTMRMPNEEDFILLNNWKLEPTGFRIKLFIPKGLEDKFDEAGVSYDDIISISPSDLSPEDWCSLLGFDANDIEFIIFQKVLRKMEEQWTIEDLIEVIINSDIDEKTKFKLENKLELLISYNIFGETKLPSILEGGSINVIDISLCDWNLRNVIVALLLKNIFIQRTVARRKEEFGERETPLPWIIIDEAHNFAPNNRETPCSNIINKLVKEGRQPGISLVLATQQPEKLHEDVLAQCDLLISHRLTTLEDIKALRRIMQTYMLEDIQKTMNELPKWKGVAIVLDDNSERLYKIRIRPRQSYHAGTSPLLIKS